MRTQSIIRNFETRKRSTAQQTSDQVKPERENLLENRKFKDREGDKRENIPFNYLRLYTGYISGDRKIERPRSVSVVALQRWFYGGSGIIADSPIPL